MVETNSVEQSDKISTFGLASFFITLTSSGFLSMGSYIIFSLTNIDSYISAIIGSVLGLIPLFIYIYIYNNSDNKDIIDLNISLFGKTIGISLNIIINVVVFFISILSLYNISQFVDIQFMPETESIYLKILILLPIAYAASKSITSIAKVSQIFMFIKIGFMLLTIIGVLKSVDISFIYPIMKNGIKPPLIASFVYVIFATYPIFLLTIIPKNQIISEKRKTRKMLLMFAIANAIIFVRFFLVTTILGEDIIPMLRYPEYIILKKFQLFSLIERVENILALYFVFNNIMYQIMSFYFIITSIKKIKIFRKIKNDNVYSYILATIILFLATQIFQNTAQAAALIKNYIPYIIAVGIFGPMLITFFAIFLKRRVSFVKSKNSNENNIILNE